MYPLTDEALRLRAPSVFAQEPHPTVSDRYGFVPTIDVVNGLRTEGWWPIQAAQTRVRDTNYRDKARHVVRFRRIDQPLEVGDGVAELVLTNSHDRSAAYALDVGLHRLVCSNGLVVAQGRFAAVRVRHGRQIVSEVIEGSYALLNHLPELAAAVSRFERVALAPCDQQLFATWALEARYGVDWSGKSPITQNTLLMPRRAADVGQDLWRTFNTVQENLMRGGLRGRSKTGRRVRTRGIRSVTTDIQLNRALWGLAERMAERQAA